MGVLRDGLGAVVRTKVRVDEVGGVVEFHHCFWLPAFVCEDVFFQTANDEIVVGFLWCWMWVGWRGGILGGILWSRR